MCAVFDSCTSGQRRGVSYAPECAKAVDGLQYPAAGGCLRARTVRARLPRQQRSHVREKVNNFVIPSEARNLSCFARAQTEERFLAALGMTKFIGIFSTTCRINLQSR